MNAPSRLPRFAAVLALALGLFLSACDALAPVDTFDLPAEPVSFTFTFQGGAISPDGVLSTGTQNLLTHVQNRGFTAADIVSVRIQSPQLTVALPLDAGVHHFNQVELRTTTGTSLVGGQNFAGTSDRAALQVRASNIAGIARDGAFRARLFIDPSAQILPNRTYTLVVSFDAVVSVEG